MASYEPMARKWAPYLEVDVNKFFITSKPIKGINHVKFNALFAAPWHSQTIQ